MVKDKKENDAKEPEVSKEEALEEILEETPEAEVVDEREIPKDTGEETSEIRNIGGAMYRVVITDTGTTFVPL